MGAAPTVLFLTASVNRSVYIARRLIRGVASALRIQLAKKSFAHIRENVRMRRSHTYYADMIKPRPVNKSHMPGAKNSISAKMLLARDTLFEWHS